MRPGHRPLAPIPDALQHFHPTEEQLGHHQRNEHGMGQEQPSNAELSPVRPTDEIHDGPDELNQRHQPPSPPNLLKPGVSCPHPVHVAPSAPLNEADDAQEDGRGQEDPGNRGHGAKITAEPPRGFRLAPVGKRPQRGSRRKASRASWTAKPPSWNEEPVPKPGCRWSQWLAP